MKEITLREKQDLLVDMLKRLQPIFQEYDIQYWAASGTLLGAVRHHGFIPWDDDMDLLVPIDDFIRLIHLLEDRVDFFYSLNLTIKSYHQINGLYHKRFKIADTRTVNIEHGEIRPAVFIDIFPVVHIRKGYIPWEKRKLQEIANFAAYYHDNGLIAHGVKKIGYLAADLLFHFLGQAREEFFEELMCRASIKGTEGSLVYLEGMDTEKECWPARCFEHTIYIQFDTITMPVPEGYDEVLTIWYGDYMVLPPESERINHSEYKMYWR